jgi:hypothetical protein
MWVSAALAVAAWPAFQVIVPLGIRAGSRIGLLFETAYLCALAGTGLAVAALEGMDRWTTRAPAWQRLSFELLAQWAVSGALVILGLALPLASGAALDIDGKNLAAGIVLTQVHLGAVGSALLRMQLPSGARSVGLLFLAWALPALLPAHGPGRLLRTSSHLEARTTGEIKPLTAELAPLVVLLSAAFLLEARHGRCS